MYLQIQDIQVKLCNDFEIRKLYPNQMEWSILKKRGEKS